MKTLILFSVMLVCFAEGLSQDAQMTIRKIDSFVTTTMNDWHTMGVAIAVVKKDSLILSKGYGYRDYTNKLEVTGNTIFPIASCSKTFVSTLMGIAFDEKKIELNKPVHQYLSQFRLFTHDLTQHATIRDLLCHGTGVPGHDWAWTFNTNYPPGIYLERISHFAPSAPLGTKYQYNSFMFFALSVLAEKVFNKDWNELVAEKFFHPLEMNNSYGSSAALKDRGNLSLTYDYRDSFRLEETRQMDDLLGGGALLSTSTDLAHWLQMWINGGAYKEHRVISNEYYRKAITSELVAGTEVDPEAIDEPFMNVGLSWFLSSYRGHYKAQHTGNVAGYSSSIAFFPFDSVGIAVLTNQNGSALINLVPDFIADVMFDLGVHDRNSMWLAKRKAFEARRRQASPINLDTVTNKALLPLTKYTGEFFNPGYGTVEITPYRNVLLLTYVDLKLVLIPKGSGHGFRSHHLEEDSTISVRGEGNVLFTVGEDAMVHSFSIPFEPQVKDIVFTLKK